MAHTISELRTLFLDPPVSARPLAILHSLDRMLKHHAGPSVEAGWLPPPDELYDSLISALTRLRDIGFGGIVVNVDYQDYLRSEERWATLIQGVRACRELGLRVWIYDEVGYPSGAAGGLVLQDHPELEAEVLAKSEYHVGPGALEIRPPSSWWYNVRAVARCGDRTTDLTDCVCEDGYLRWTADEECTIERYDARSGFEGTHATLNVHSVRRYINVINPDAVNRVYDLTYQAYIDRLDDDLSTVEAFFTDEPSFMAVYHCELPERYRSKVRVKDEPLEEWDRLPQLPWRKSLPEDFTARWGYDLLPVLQSLYGGNSPMDCRVRHDFQQLISELYADVFFNGIQSRLSRYGIPFSGHVLAEESIVHHAGTQGNTIELLKKMGKPGIDMLTSLPERIAGTSSLLTCKYGSSAAHLCGRDDIMSEVSDWEQQNIGITTTLEQRRAALAAQSALGITTFTNYYRWKGIEREDIRRFMDCCARFHSAVRHGTHIAPAAVLYPIRTAWTHYLPSKLDIVHMTQPEPLASLDGALLSIARGLLNRQIDFDFIDGPSLAESEASGGEFQVANESHEMLVIPPGAVLCPKDITSIRRLAEAGVCILAFEPLSVVSLPHIKGTPDPDAVGESACEALTALAGEYPETVKIFEIDEDWAGYAEQQVRREMVLGGDTESVLVRCSRFDDGDAFLIVNTADQPIDLDVAIARAEAAEVWNPVDASISPLDSKLSLPSYGTVIVISQHRQA